MSHGQRYLIVSLLLLLAWPPVLWAQRDRLLPSVVAAPSADFKSTVLRLDQAAGADQVLAHTSGGDTEAAFLRLRLLLVAPTPITDLTVNIRDRSNGTVQSMSLNGTSGAREIWSRIVPGNKYTIEAKGASQPPGTTLTVWQMLRDVTPPKVLSIIGTDDREAITSISDAPIRAAARAVVKLLFQVDSQTYACTGFLISNKRIITNEHCIATPEACASTVVLFDYDSSAMVPAARQRACSVLRRIDHTLDYSVFDMDQPADAAIQPLTLAAAAPVAGKALLVIEHPGGEPKQISRKDCSVVHNPVRGNGDATDFTHSCDTLGGSSGSPMLNTALQVVGLHHFGIGDDEPNYNRAVRIELIAPTLSMIH